MLTRATLVLAALVGLSGVDASARGQQADATMDAVSRERTRVMLRHAYEKVKKHYYDVKFHGLDWDARYRDFDAQLKAVKALNQGMALISSFLDGLNDSHVYFVPPARPYQFDYGYRLQVVGDKVFVVRVRPGTDAAGKVQTGDELVALNGSAVSRANFHVMDRFLYLLSPQPATRLLLRNPAGQTREIVVATKTQQGKRALDLSQLDGEDLWQLIRQLENDEYLARQRYYEAGDVMIWKMPQFMLSDSEVDALFNRARRLGTLILDLRGNPGGAVDTLERMVGNLFDKDVTIARRVGREQMKPIIAKSRGGTAFTGRLIVLVDGGSASAAELFARVVQLEGRGTVIGDRTSGSVTEARVYSEFQGTETQIYYSFVVTDADLLMKDGKSLEHTGVTPSEIVLPSAQDLADARDPVLSLAAALVNLALDPVQAGKLFPVEWRPF
jgi:C-terminal processing protease CtpA/Prc